VVIAVIVPLLLPTFRKVNPESQLAKARLEEEAADKKLQSIAPTMSAAPALREADETSPPRGAERSNETPRTSLALADAGQAKDDAQGLRRDLEKEKSPAARPRHPMPCPQRRSPPPTSQITSLDESPKRAVEVQSRFEPPRRNRDERSLKHRRPTWRDFACRKNAGVAPAPSTCHHLARICCVHPALRNTDKRFSRRCAEVSNSKHSKISPLGQRRCGRLSQFTFR
jgi:hypothetical protein